MRRTNHALVSVLWVAIAAPCLGQNSEVEQACTALLHHPELTIHLAELRTAIPAATRYCYVRGFIAPGIRYHVQLPLPANWNQRFLHWGDGGKDGDLDFADHRVTEGYAVANSNMGHDVGVEPGASFGFNNRQAEIDFAYRAVHLTVNAAKTLIRAYYRKPPKYSYHEGCSTGGRQGLIAAQRYPYDFDGIVAGAPVDQHLVAGHVWFLQRMYRDRFAGALAFDNDGDGRLDSLAKLKLLEESVLKKCDALDGVKDGVVSDPHGCPFDPDVDLRNHLCPGDKNSDGCFTMRQIQTVRDFYRGPHDSKGVRAYWGKAKGAESQWAGWYIPHGSNPSPPSALRLAADHLNFLFYETDPGVPPPDLQDLTYKLNKKATPPEWAWWEFNIDDVASGKADVMKTLLDARDPNLNRFLFKKNGKLILYHGWSDPGPSPDNTIAYFEEMVKATFAGNRDEARQRVRLFLAPGMSHCGGGPGPNEWDKLAPLVEWVENGKAPDFLVASHRSNGKVDNERPLCPYPKQAVYTGPQGGQHDRANWIAANFTCK